MKIGFKNFFLFLILVGLCLPSWAEPTALPAIVEARMTGKGLYSERSEIGDEVEVELLEPINLYSQRIFVPASSIIAGKIQMVEEAGRGLRKGKVKVAFNRIIFPNGYVLGAEATITDHKTEINEDGEEVEGKLNLREKLWRFGKVGAGAILGGPVGAAAATGILVFDKGGKVRIPPGQVINVNVEEVMYLDQQRDVKGRVNGVN
ncbi:MAG: hypothetical protein SFU25_01710 [Candidatus Caenarcaniphilales bacterium]|nr:hypothetical protein [Candidatus Caenarcaniphilales bacterium]